MGKQNQRTADILPIPPVRAGEAAAGREREENRKGAT